MHAFDVYEALSLNYEVHGPCVGDSSLKAGHLVNCF